MKGVHKDLFDRATDLYDEEGFEAARDFLIEATKKPYKNRHIVPIELPIPKLEMKPVPPASRFNDMQNYKIPKKKPRDFNLNKV